MDVGLTTRAPGTTALISETHPAPLPVRNAVPTELAPSQSVTAATDSAPARNDATHGADAGPQTTQDVVIDPQTHEVIYRVIDVASGQVVSQVPDQMAVQIAAYTQAVQRAVDKGESLTEAEAKADLDLQV